MAINIAIGDVWTVRHACRTATQVGINVVHYICTAIGGLPITDADFADNVDTNISVKFKAMLPTTATYWGVQVQRILPQPTTFPVSLSGRNGPGTIASNLLPEQVSGIATFRTASAGRKFRGRAYLPFPPINAVNTPADTPTVAYIALMDAVTQEMGTPYVIAVGGRTGTMTPVIYHRSNSTTTIVTQALTRPYWATQRRRGDAGRPNLNPPW